MLSFLNKQPKHAACEVHHFLNKHYNLTRRRLVSSMALFSIVFLGVNSLTATQVYSSGDEIDSVDETYEILAGSDTGDTSILAVTEEGFFTRNALENKTGRSTTGGILEYEVQPGDSISGIARNFEISGDTILAANNLYNANAIRAGQTLKILPVNGVLYKTAKDDTLDAIAKKYSVKTEDILAQNNLLAGDKIGEGQELILPGATPIKPEAPKPARYIASRSYTTNRSVGAMPDTDTPIDGKLLWPTTGKISQYFRAGHYAVDISNRAKPMIVAARGGTVIKAATGWSGGYGNHVIIDHGDGLQTLYAHMDYLSVSVGDTVSTGAVLGRMGNTGRVYGATGIHLHFEVRVGGVKKNPLAYL